MVLRHSSNAITGGLCGRRGVRVVPNSPGGAISTAALLLVTGVGIAGCNAPQPPIRLAAMDREQPQTPIASGILLASAAGKYLAGNHAQRMRDFGAAADYLTDALTVDESNRNLRRRAFLAMLTSGQMEAAAKLARVIVKTDSELPLARLSLAVEDARAGKFDAAAKRYKRMPRRGVNAVMIPLLLAWTWAGQGDTEAALDSLAVLVKNGRFRVIHDLHAGLINEIGGNLAAAEKAYAQARDRRLTLSVVQALGTLFERTGRSGKAKALYAEFLKSNPNTEIVEAALVRVAAGKRPERAVKDAYQGMAEVFYNIANTLTRGRAIERALIYGNFFLHMRPDYPVGQMLVAGTLELLERYDDAIKVYDGIKPDSPLRWTARMRKASNLDALGRTKAAIAELSSMSGEQVARSDALVELGDLLRGKKRYEEAITAYTDALPRIGEPKKRHWSLFYSRGISFERAKRWPDAEKDFLRALELNPDQPYVLNYLGYSWIDQGINMARARKMIERAVKNRPNDGHIVDSLGWALYRMGEYRAATRRLEQAVLLRPEDPTINDHLGDAYWRVGRQLEANFQWKRVLTLKPEADQILSIEKKIRDGLVGDAPASGGG